MKDYPVDMLDLIDMFPNEDSCMEYLSMIRWPSGYVCLRCNSINYWKMSSGLYRCKECKYTGSVISGTLFQDTRKPLFLWFQAIWYVVNHKNGVSALGLQKALGLGSYHTAWEWLHKLRRAMVHPGRDKLKGTIEMDETFFGGVRSGKRGRGAEGKTLVLIAAENVGNGIGRVRLSPIDDAYSDTLTQAASQMIEPGSIIRTDGWDGYNALSSKGFIHVPISHKNAESGDATPLTHRVASLLKRWWLGTHQGAISHEHLQYYLDEFTFRFNRRTSKSRGKLFYRLIEQAIHIDPITAKNLKSTYSS